MQYIRTIGRGEYLCHGVGAASRRKEKRMPSFGGKMRILSMWLVKRVYRRPSCPMA